MHALRRSIIICMILLLPYVAAHAAQFASVFEKKPATPDEIATNAAGADVIFIGETHDNAQHHQAQLAILRSLHALKVPLAIGLEMFTTEDQQQLNVWVGGKLNEESFKPIYSRNWSYGWPLYRELFIFARDNRIPLIALNIPKAVMAKVMAQGASALPASELPPNISWVLNDAQGTYMRTIARQVFGNSPPDKLLARLCQAQALRNQGMAWQVASYLQKHAGAKVVVLAGTWHAVKTGVPEQLSTYGQFRYQVILPELPEFTLEQASVKEADYLIVK